MYWIHFIEGVRTKAVLTTLIFALSYRRKINCIFVVER